MGKLVLFILFFVMSVTNCSGEPEVSTGIPEDELIEIYIKVSLIQESDLGNAEKDYRISKYIETTGRNWKEIEEKIEWYKDDPGRWRTFFTKMSTKLQEMEPGEDDFRQEERKH